MHSPDTQRILITGAGIAGLSAALALAERGFSVLVAEKAAFLSEAGAGLQLAPNATRLLARLGVLEHLRKSAVTPQALYLIDGIKAEPLMRMELGSKAEARWHAPYLVCHRADLQAALLKCVTAHPRITLLLNANVLSHTSGANGVTIRIDHDQQIKDYDGTLLVACDGVWSQRRAAAKSQQGLTAAPARFTSHIAWRTTLERSKVPAQFLDVMQDDPAVSAWLGHGVHFIAYPVKSGDAYNFVAITDGEDIGASWNMQGDKAALTRAFAKWSDPVKDVIASAPHWSFWPLFEMATTRFVIGKNTILLGDAAHALTPFAAQGAAMAIEDAMALAAHLSPQISDHQAGLAQFEKQRLQRIAQVARRGKLNRFAYHASGPLALGRNLLFKLRKPDDFLKDLDWLYSYDATEVKSQ